MLDTLILAANAAVCQYEGDCLGDLPLTGLDLALILVIGGACILIWALIRYATRRPK